MSSPEVWSLATLKDQDRKSTVIWCTPSVKEKVVNTFPYRLATPLRPLPDVKTLVVVGGGTLIDEAKLWRFDHAPKIRLVAVPSIWGSGAEVSPIVVVNRGGKKVIRIDERFKPDVRVIWAEIGESVPGLRALHACADCWAHALEGFLSPLADAPLRIELSEIIRRMFTYPMVYDQAWFQLSATACAGQVRSSVGLVHGIAHILEGQLCSHFSKSVWCHASLCATYLWPVMEFNRQISPRWLELMNKYNIDPQRLRFILKLLFDEKLYNETLPFLKECWSLVLRDPCTRTNCTLVRPAQLDFFLEKNFT